MSAHHIDGMPRFDSAAFASAIHAVIAARQLSDREVARQAGLSGSTITRTIRQGRSPDVEGFMRLADWAGLSLDAFIVRHRPIPEASSVSQQRRVVAAQQAAEAAALTLRLMLDGGPQ